MYDLIIIGSGWAGINAAKKAKEAGLSVCIIEKGELGGTCLNRGCIPTKALLQSAKALKLCKKASSFGIDGVIPSLNFSKIQERKNKIVVRLRRGVEFSLKGVDIINAEAKLFSNTEIMAGGKTLKTKYVLIATGSSPIELDNVKFDGQKIVSSDEMLDLKEAPLSLLIIGGGVIGCEFASLFFALGTKVTIIEKMPQLIPGLDKEAAQRIEACFKKKGIKVNTGADAAALNLGEYELVSLCVGRRANTKGLGLGNAGIKTQNGAIIVDDFLKTNIPNIFAAGDCTQKFMLAHFAAYQGRIAAENMAGGANLRKADSNAVPNCIFTDPEIACVGLSEEAAKAHRPNIKVSRFDFLGSAMAHIIDEIEGFIKIVSDTASGEILGACIIGPHAVELIGILTPAVSSGLKISQLQQAIFAHPTLSEGIAEALR